MNERFLRAEMLLGSDAMQKLKNSHVAVFGLGGVGSWCAEALARSGIGALTLIDEDSVSETNINRQLVALTSTVAQPKADVMARRIADISPETRTVAMHARYEATDRERFFTEKYDYIVDAIDLVACKVDLIKSARERDIPIVSALGTGNKADASLLEITDISKTSVCPLARIMRKECAKRGIRHLKVLFSTEDPIPSYPSAISSEELPEGRRALPGSVAFVPSVAGLMIAGEVIRDLIRG